MKAEREHTPLACGLRRRAADSAAPQPTHPVVTGRQVDGGTPSTARETRALLASKCMGPAERMGQNVANSINYLGG